jgi:hypothetical protein
MPLPVPSALVPVAPAAPAGGADPRLVNQLEAFLAGLVADLEPDAVEARRHGRGRPRILPALALWGGLVVCVLRGWSSQQALWRLLAGKGLWQFPPLPVSDQAVYKRLAQADDAPVERVFAALTTLLVERRDPHADRALAPFAAEVFAVDETTLDPVARKLPALRGLPPGDARLLPGKLAGVFDVRRQLWRRIVHVPDARQNEKVAARALVADLPAGSLLLFDLGYFAFEWFDDLTGAGRLWISRLREKTSYETVHTAYAEGETRDELVWLGAHRADRAKHAVRRGQVRRGRVLHRYLTNVRDPRRLPLAEIARLYARRWDIEMAVNLVKTELGLHLLWSAKPAVVLHQVWATLTIAQLLQALRCEIAARAGVDPFEVSMHLLVEYLPQVAARGLDPRAAFLENAHALGFIRPSRRTTTEAPNIPAAALRRPPPDLILARTPRYARRNCGPRPPRARARASPAK